MTNINLTRSQFLTKLLKNVAELLSSLSPHDTALQKRISELNQTISDPLNVDGEKLFQNVNRLKEIASGYDLKSEKNKTFQILPELFHHIAIELDHLINSAKILERDKISKAILDSNRFFKYSIRLI